MLENFRFDRDLSFSGTASFPEANPKYQEILKLESLLICSGIPHIKQKIFDGWKISYFYEEEMISDVVEHLASYGSEYDLLEVGDSKMFSDYSQLNLFVDSGKIFSSTVWQGYTALEIWLVWSMDCQKRMCKFKSGDYMKTWTKILQEGLPLEFNPVIDRTIKSAYDLAICGINYQEYPENFEYMNGYDLTFLSIAAIISGDADFIRALTESQGRKHLMSYILDILIPCAIAKKNHEIQLLLTDYKYRNGIFRENKFNL